MKTEAETLWICSNVLAGWFPFVQMPDFNRSDFSSSRDKVETKQSPYTPAGFTSFSSNYDGDGDPEL